MTRDLTTTREVGVNGSDPSSARITHELMTVTSDMAVQWLEHKNRHNRPIRQQRVVQYVDIIRRGEWEPAVSTISFDEEGNLLDGQHRLWAVVEADIPVQMLVVQGLPARTQMVMDMGARRSLRDTLSMMHVSNATHTAAMINRLWAWGQNPNGSYMRRKIVPTIPQAMQFFEDHREGVTDAVNTSERVARRAKFRINRAVLGACYYRFRDLDDKDAHEFMSQVATGIRNDGQGLNTHDAVYRYRESLGNVDRTPFEEHAVTIKVWNAFRRGESISQLSWRGGGAAPEAFPEPL